jgi:hypothetical protein
MQPVHSGASSQTQFCPAPKSISKLLSLYHSVWHCVWNDGSGDHRLRDLSEKTLKADRSQLIYLGCRPKWQSGKCYSIMHIIPHFTSQFQVSYRNSGELEHSHKSPDMSKCAQNNEAEHWQIQGYYVMEKIITCIKNEAKYQLSTCVQKVVILHQRGTMI